MKKLRDTCIEFFKSDETKKDVKEIIMPIANMIYNEVYIYIWIIAIYNIFFIFVILAMFFILLRLSNNQPSSVITSSPF